MKFDPTNIDQVKKAIASNGKNIKYVSNPSDSLCIHALNNGASLYHIKNPSFNVICKYLAKNSMKESNYTLEFLYKYYPHLITKKLIIFASKHWKTYGAIWKILNKTSFNPIYITSVNSVCDCLTSIYENEPHLINDIIEFINELNTNNKLCLSEFIKLKPIILYAISNNIKIEDKIICLFPELIKTEEQLQLAIINNEKLPQLDFKSLSDKTIKLLIKRNPTAYIQMVEQTEELCLYAVKQNIECLKFINNPDAKVIEYCLYKKLDSYFLMENPTEEAIRLYNLISILKLNLKSSYYLKFLILLM